MNYQIVGGKKLSGTVKTNTSKNAAVAMLAASLLNKGTTTLRRMPRIEEVKRLIEVMRSIGVSVDWKESGDISIKIPPHFDLEKIDHTAAEKTRSIALFIAPLAHALGSFALPAPGGCDLGKRSLGPHIDALARLGIIVSGDETTHTYRVEAKEMHAAEIVMYEASDTGTENVLIAAAKIAGKTTIKFASSNYMVQDLCVFLQQMGVKIDGIGTSTLIVQGLADINDDITGVPSEDPIESMFFVSLAATTKSELKIERCPIDFLELELYTLRHMGMKIECSAPYAGENGHTQLVDITVHSSNQLKAPPEKVAAKPYPGINFDNLPYFVPVATQAKGETLIHDWAYETRAKYYMELNKLGADISLLDPHRALVKGPTKLHSATIDAPPAFRPASIILIAMLAAEGESLLRNVYPISRGYENLHERLKKLGASVEAIE